MRQYVKIKLITIKTQQKLSLRSLDYKYLKDRILGNNAFRKINHDVEKY